MNNIKMEKQWKTVREFLDFLNERIDYVVLRNGSELLKPDFVLKGQDIDLLCSNKNQFMKLCGNKQWANRLSINNNVLVNIQGRLIPVDVYTPGDGYYDKQWEKDMLWRRRKEEVVYVLSEDDFFYSLAYHALYHKNTFKEKYKKQLQAIQPVQWNGNEGALEEILESFMISKGYKYTYPVIPSYVNFRDVPENRIYKSYKVLINKEIEKIQFVLRKRLRKGVEH